ncbi:MAG: DUF169 domain-containing protein [Syntrophomonadaceae bacterium]|nr:DUF169 domain-containing protein [Syntrophomonadaceae bacterium]
MDWEESSKKLVKDLRLRTSPVAFKSLEKEEQMGQIEGVTPWKKSCTFCQVPYLARVVGLTVGITRKDGMLPRCKRIHGLLPVSEETMLEESQMLSGTWMPSVEEAMKQQNDYPRVPPGEAIVVGPLGKVRFDPEVILIYGNPAQIMMIMCGLQKVKYERFPFFFIGEGACADSLAQCYTTSRPAVAIPCYGERAMGQVADDEIVIALTPDDLERALKGMNLLKRVGFKYPIIMIGGMTNPLSALASIYPEAQQKK